MRAEVRNSEMYSNRRMIEASSAYNGHEIELDQGGDVCGLYMCGVGITQGWVMVILAFGRKLNAWHG